MDLETEIPIDLPYGAEYAKSNRSKCTVCKQNINKDDLRLSTRIQSSQWDGIQDKWHHEACFFKRPKKDLTEASIRGFEGLKWDDQVKIRENMKSKLPSTSMKRVAVDAVKVTDLPFGCDYAKSSRANCIVCQTRIMKGELRVAVRIPAESWDGVRDLWNHYECFWQKSYNDLNEANMKGFESLKWEDQEKIRANIQKIVAKEEVSVKEETIDGEVTNEEKVVKMEVILPQVPSADYAKSNKSKCKECKSNIEKDGLRLKYKSGFYHPACLKKMNAYEEAGENINEFGNLKEEDQTTLRGLFAVKQEPTSDGPSAAKKPRMSDTPENLMALKLQSDSLWTVLDNIRGKLVKDQILKLIKENNSWGLKKLGPEQNLELLADLIVFGCLPPCDSCGKTLLRYNADEHNYKCSSYISDYTRCPFSIRNPVRSEFIVPKEFETYEFLKDYHMKKILPNGRVYSASILNNEVTAIKAKERKKREGEEEENRRCIVKGGCTVDPRCSIAEKVHVYIDEYKRPWQALLTSAELMSGKNSYYKLQLVEHDRSHLYCVFRSWGRVGTSGGTKTEDFDEDLQAAKQNFESLFQEKSQNIWGEEFVKVAGGMDLIEMDVDDSKLKEIKSLDPSNSTSKLSLPVREIISLFFDIQLMIKEMAEFELDTEKMPLAKLSRNHILRAHSVLSDLSRILAQESPQKIDIVDCCNQFYSLIPHSAGIGRLPLINTDELLKKKIEMLDSLLEMEIAYKMIKEEKGTSSDSQVDVFDRYYLSLSCDIQVLSRESEEFKWIQLYVNNGKMKTHHFEIKIKEVFKVDRHGEIERYKKKSKKIHNKRLLWHGSRTTNFGGILSRGLCIAPSEAPVNGYMFGKGVYFADCVSKSAQYCSTAGRSDAFLLLTEVALGNMQEERHAKMSIEKPKKGFHSVKGLGATAPDDKDAITIEDGIMVPCGKARKINDDKGLSLLYNEYIVYDEAQARLRYLIHADIIH